MSQFPNIKEVLFFDGTNNVKVNVVSIKLDEPLTGLEAIPSIVIHGNLPISSFYCSISPNKYSIVGYFTIEAFSGLSTIDIDLLINQSQFKTWKNVDVSNIPALYTALYTNSYADGDQTWLNNFIS